MPAVQLRSRLSNTAARAGSFVSEAEVALKLEGNAEVYKPDGTPLVVLRRGALRGPEADAAYPALHALKSYGSDNRGTYAGVKGKHVESAIVGYFDRQGGRFPFCRETAFVGKEPEAWRSVMPLVDKVAGVFKDTLPVRYLAQMRVAEKTHPAFRIGQTPFTTLTVNNNVVGAIHTDKGDYKDGFGCISVHRRGNYSGAWLVFPEYSVGVDLRDGDLLFFNSHDWHGVTPFRDAVEGYERISVVYYFRSRMAECGSPADEIERARARYGSLDNIPDPEED